MICLDASNDLIDGSCVLLFGDHGAEPVVVAKAARTAEGRAVFEQEYETLLRLEQAGLNAAGPAAPAPLGRCDDGEWLVTLQGALAGTPLKNIAGRRLFSRGAIAGSFERILGWWQRFQDCFDSERVVVSEAVYQREVLAPLARYLRRFLVDERQRVFLERRFGDGRVLLGRELPFMVRHGDFCAANLVWRPEGVAVFDWEFALEPRPPLFDLLYFFCSTRFPFTAFGSESTHFDSFVATYWGQSYFSTAVRERLGRFCASQGIARDVAADLFLLALIDVANMKFEGLLHANALEEPEAGGAPPADERKLALWRAFRRPDKDAPFARISSGVFVNLRFVSRHGLPELLAP